MERREFIGKLGLGLAAGWAATRLAGPLTALAGDTTEMRLALLSDAHLQDGDPTRPEARALARAVAEIRAFTPAPDLVLFAGDLAHRGSPAALELAKEILANLPAPLVLVMGEEDGSAEPPGPWPQLFGTPWFSRSFAGCHLLGLHTAWSSGPAGPAFRLGEPGRRWLARELAHLNPATPLILLSHAPLARIFRPWQQWTEDAHLITPWLARFRHVVCFHGHVHGPQAFSSQPVNAAQKNPPPLAAGGRQDEVAAESPIHHQGLLATSWPLPQALQGTPAALNPGLAALGCGWSLMSISCNLFQFHHRVWQA
jgi:Icc protein